MRAALIDRRVQRYRRGLMPLTALALAVAMGAAEPRFFADDPLSREPETGDASKAEPWDIDLYYDLAYNLFVTTRRTPENIRAQNVNTIDEVPDSSWFTNRIGSRPMSIEELQRGPVNGPAPDPSVWTVDSREELGRRAGVHGHRRQRRDVVRVVRRAR